MAGPGCRSMVLPFLLVAVVVPSGSDITSRDAVLRSCESRGIHADWHGFHTALLPRGAQRGIRAVGERRAGTPSISIGGRESCIRHPQDVRCATIRGGKSFEEESEQEQQVGSVPFLTRLDRALAESDEEYPPSDAHGDDGVRVRVLGSSESGEFIQESGDQEDQEDAEIVVANELMQVGVYTPIEVMQPAQPRYWLSPCSASRRVALLCLRPYARTDSGALGGSDAKIVDMGLEMLALQPQGAPCDRKSCAFRSF